MNKLPIIASAGLHLTTLHRVHLAHAKTGAGSAAMAESLFRKMLDEAGVQVLLARALSSVEMQHQRLVAAHAPR